MYLKEIDLHGKNLNEALDTVEGFINGLLKHDDVGVVFVHGRGKHSRRCAVLKQEIRRLLLQKDELNDHNYLVILGEEPYPITDNYDDACVIVVKDGYENESTINGIKQQEKHFIVRSEEGKAARRNTKKFFHSKKS